jgi:predicted acetyltransferase
MIPPQHVIFHCSLLPAPEYRNRKTDFKAGIFAEFPEPAGHKLEFTVRYRTVSDQQVPLRHQETAMPTNAIREIRNDDHLKAYYALCRYCFIDDIGWTGHIHPLPGKGSYSLGVFDDNGRCESGISDIRFITRYFGKDWPSSGISAVASDPTARNQGQIRRIMEALLRRDRDEGVGLSYLYPFSYRFYRKFGYGTLGSYRVFTLDPEEIRPIKSDLHVAQINWEGDDFEHMCDLNNHWIQEYDGASYWPYRSFEASKASAERYRHYYYLLRDGGGTLKAWLRFSQNDDWSKPGMFVHKMVWADPQGLAGIFAFLASHRSQIKEIQLVGPHGLPVDQFCLEHRPKTRLSQEWMARPLDPAALLAAAVAERDFHGEFAFSLIDPSLEENSGRYRIQGGTVEFTPEAADDLPDALPFDLFSSLLLGGLSTAQARLAGLIDPHQLEGSETLFSAGRNIMISEHF